MSRSGSRARLPEYLAAPTSVVIETSAVLPSSDQRLRAYANLLLRHRLAIIVTAVLVLAAGVVPALLEEPTYAATSAVRVRADNTASPFDTDTQDNAQTRSRDLLTSVEVIESGPLRALVQERLGADADPFDQVTATLVGFSEVIQVRIQAPSAEGAAAAANAYAEVYVEERQRQSVQALVEQSEELRRRSASANEQMVAIDAQLADPATDPVTTENLRVSRAALAAQILDFSRRADELDVEAALREGGTEVVEWAGVDTDPVSPQPVRAGLTAAVLGLLAGIAVGVVREVAQDRLSSVEDLGLVEPAVPVLASIPHSRTAGLPEGHEVDPAVHEAFRYLRTALRLREEPLRSVVVTSAVAGEGKTTTAVNLALAFAESGSRVVLVDADLRRPTVHRTFDLLNDLGLSSILARTSRFGEAISYVRPNLAVLPAGPPSDAANELLERPEFAQLVQTAAAQSDLVIVDVPPALPVADPLVAARAVDGVLVVARLGQVRRREVRTLLQRLREARLPVVGLVANDVTNDVQYGTYEARASS
jgi:capsular exopolysaccharide synthesis family protein